MKVKIVSAKKLDELYTGRCGVIPVTIVGGKLYFQIGKYKSTSIKEFTDFGGGVKKGESALRGGFREFTEETKGIFSSINIDNALALVDANADPFPKKEYKFKNNMAIIFVPVSNKWIERSNQEFKSRGGHSEISELCWVDEKNFDLLVHEKLFSYDGYTFWYRIRSFLRQGWTNNFKNRLFEIIQKEMI